MSVIEPMIDAMNTPIHPDSCPINCDIWFAFKTLNTKPITSKILKNCGRIFSNDFHAFLSAWIVFYFDLKKEIPSATAVTI